MLLAIQNHSTFPNRLIAPHLRNLLHQQNLVARAYYDKYDTSASKVKAASQMIFAHPNKVLPASWWPVLIMHEAGSNGDLGVHYYDPGPTARLFMDSIADYAGPNLADQRDALLAAMSHEICEMTANPGAEREVNHTHSAVVRRWQREVCDPVNAIAYPITRKGVTTYVSDWVKPGWFLGANGAWDAAGEITKHHQILADGCAYYKLVGSEAEYLQAGPYDES